MRACARECVRLHMYDIKRSRQVQDQVAMTRLTRAHELYKRAIACDKEAFLKTEKKGKKGKKKNSAIYQMGTADSHLDVSFFLVMFFVLDVCIRGVTLSICDMTHACVT